MRRLATFVLCCLLLGCGGKENMTRSMTAPQAAEATVAPSDTPEPTTEPTPTPTASPTPTAAPELTPTAEPVPTAELTPTPEPTPTPLFVPRDENGNLIINPDLYESITQTEFPLPSAPVVLIYHTHAEEAARTLVR